MRADARSLEDSLPDSAVELWPASEHVGVEQIAGVGDLDDDGIGDYAVVVGGLYGVEAIHVFSGAAGLVSGSVATLPDQGPLTTILTPTREQQWIDVVEGPHDIDGDGRLELLVRSSFSDPEYGPANLFVFADPTSTPEIDLDQPSGMRIGAGWSFIEFPTRSIGDLDGDGATELVATLGTAAYGSTHRVVLVRGGPLEDDLDLGNSSRALTVYERPGPEPGSAWLGAAGDFDGDGAPDLTIVDARAGGVVVISGQYLTQLLALGEPADPPALDDLIAAGFAGVIESPTPGSIGHDYLVLDDLDDDGSQELVILDEQDASRGRSFNLLGGPWAASQTFQDLAGNGRLLELEGVRDEDRAEWGAVGDFDGDGRDDLVLAARTAAAAPCAQGLIYALPGSVAPSSWSLDAVETGELGVLWTGPSAPGWGPARVSNLGDVSGDGIDDLATWSLEGRAWVLPGPSVW